jgi:hypothetical protein
MAVIKLGECNPHEEMGVERSELEMMRATSTNENVLTRPISKLLMGWL